MDDKQKVKEFIEKLLELYKNERSKHVKGNEDRVYLALDIQELEREIQSLDLE